MILGKEPTFADLAQGKDDGQSPVAFEDILGNGRQWATSA
jgi:hypothetical protein